MHCLRRKLKEFVWVALVAFVGLAIVPTISRAMHVGVAPQESSGAGHASVAVAGAGHAHHHHEPATDPAPASGNHSHSLDHCEMCLVAACAFALAPSAPGIETAAVVDGCIGHSAGAAPRLHDDWSPASPRGPPIPV